VDKLHHVALVKGKVSPDVPILVRVHASCLAGDVFSSVRCNCGLQIKAAMRKVEEAGNGVILYMRPESRGIDFRDKIKKHASQDPDRRTGEDNLRLGLNPDLRDYGIGAQMLVDLGVRKMRLMTDNPTKIVGLEGYGLEVVEQVPIVRESRFPKLGYLKTAKRKVPRPVHVGSGVAS
jgi:3,4-dihydroxy 2-butanone 4-phosphate synthase/GTP cyclohydrolase II